MGSSLVTRTQYFLESARCLAHAGTTSDASLRRALGGALSLLRSGDARLVFYHVHKSGGSSMCNALVT